MTKEKLVENISEEKPVFLEERPICIIEVNENLRRVELGEELTRPLRQLNNNCEFKKKYNEWCNIRDGLDPDTNIDKFHWQLKAKEKHIPKLRKPRKTREERNARQREHYKNHPEYRIYKKYYHRLPEVKAREKLKRETPEYKTKQKEWYNRPENVARRHELYLKKKQKQELIKEHDTP
jgi:hypothetical protein